MGVGEDKSQHGVWLFVGYLPTLASLPHSERQPTFFFPSSLCATHAGCVLGDSRLATRWKTNRAARFAGECQNVSAY